MPTRDQAAPILICGGGIGGLTAAIALAQHGLQTIVLEQAETFADVGAGIQLAPNATRGLTALGLADDLAEVGFAPRAAEIRDSAGGGLLLRTALGAEAVRRWGAPYLQVHRADLHARLLRQARDAGVEVRTASRVLAMDQDDRGVGATTAAGVVRGSALIGCDGVHSPVRQMLFGPTPARFTGQVAWRALVPTDRLPPGMIAPDAIVWTGGGRHLVHYYVRGGAMVNLVGVVDGQAWSAESWSEPGSAAAFSAAFAGWPAPAAALLDAVETCWRWAIHDRPPLPRWSLGRIALLGDAAHPTAPFLAQGAAMAIEDACSLASRLTTASSIPDALSRYGEDRRTRAAKVRAWARRNGMLFHLPRTARRAAFALARGLAADGDAGPSLDWLYGVARNDKVAPQHAE